MRTININVLNYNKAKVAEKLGGGANPDSIKFISKGYETNGTKDLIEHVLQVMIDEAKDNEVVPAGTGFQRLEDPRGNTIPFTYYTHDATEDAPGKILGIFVDYAANPRLMDSKYYEAFKNWFIDVVSDWFQTNELTFDWKLNIEQTGDKCHVEYPVE